MSAEAGNFALLLELARETSSEKRRELLRQVTDIFLDNKQTRSEAESAHFDEIFNAVSEDLEHAVRIELARKVAMSNAPIRKTARQLALDEIEIARPVIERSRALAQEDLIDVIKQKGQDHMMAVTKRDDIGEDVSSALVEKGDDHVVAALLENQTARMNRTTYERVADRAQSSPVLHAPFIRNRKVPLDLLNELYVVAEKQLRREIMRKFHGVSPAELETALETGRNRLSSAYGALPDDFVAAQETIDEIERRRPLEPALLPGLLRQNHRTAFCIAFAKLAGVEFMDVYRVVRKSDVDAMAMLCKGAGFDRSLFVTLCLLLAKEGSNFNKAEAYAALYQEVPVAAAQRALRFWRVRAKTMGQAA